PRAARARVRALEEAEELGVGREYNRRVLADGRAVGVEAAHEGVELGVRAVGLRVDPRGLGVALAARDLRVALRVGDDHRRLAVRVGADPPRALVALGAAPAREPLALGLHPRVDALLDAGRQLGAVDADVGDLDPEGLHLGLGARSDLAHDRVALRVEHLLERVAPDRLPDVVAHRAVDPGLGRPGPRVREGALELLRIADAPDRVAVDDQLLAVAGEDRVGL